MRFRNPNHSRITKNKIAALFDRIVRRNGEKVRGSIFDILTDLFIEFKRFFIKPKSPRFEFSPLIKEDVIVAEKFNDTMLDAMEDIYVCTDEVNAIKPIVIGSYNAARQMGKELENRSETALSKITDVRLFEGQLGQEILVFGDDFQNTDKIDEVFSLAAPSADVRTADGLVTLNRIETINLVDEGTNITCEPIMPSDIITDVNTGNANTDRYYEGNFYNFIGSARPEGGNWHLEERLLLDDDALNSASSASSVNSSPSAFLSDMDGPYIPGTQLRPQDIVIYDRGASETEKNNIRKRMFDENSSTFWEAEYVKDFAPSQTDDIELTLEELAAEAVQQDTKDFEVQITVDLGRVKPVSWINLEPINFGETAWLEVTDVALANSEEEGFRTIPNMFKHRFANTLTDEANEELQADIAAQILAPDRYSFRGKGVFNFPMVPAQYVRLKIKQKVPVPNLYQRLTIQLTRGIDTTITVNRSKTGPLGGILGGNSSSSNTTITQTRMSRLVKLTYAQTVKSHFNNLGASEFAGETGGTSSSFSEQDTPNMNFFSQLGDFIFGSSSSQTSVSNIDSGWSIAKDWLEVYYNKMRYGIGVRELSIFNYRFSPVSEFVSKRFTTPKEIIKAQLEVTEEIPSEFNPENKYIEYYLSFDAENWHRINPTGHPTLYAEDGQVVPEILNINFDIAGAGGLATIKSVETDTPVRSARIKVVMKNDQSLGDPDMYSPVLKKYRIKLFPRTSLSRG